METRRRRQASDPPGPKPHLASRAYRRPRPPRWRRTRCWPGWAAAPPACRPPRPLAGVPGVDALAATLLYRIVAYWLPLPAGATAYVLFRHRYKRPPSNL